MDSSSVCVKKDTGYCMQWLYMPESFSGERWVHPSPIKSLSCCERVAATAMANEIVESDYTLRISVQPKTKSRVACHKLPSKPLLTHDGKPVSRKLRQTTCPSQEQIQHDPSPAHRTSLWLLYRHFVAGCDQTLSSEEHSSRSRPFLLH